MTALTCPFLTDTGVYAIGALPAPERRRMALHVRDCAACRAEVAGFAAVLRCLARTTLGAETLPPHAGGAAGAPGVN